MNVQLHLGDCLDVMRGMPDGCVDAVVTDPPYNVGLKYLGASDSRKDYARWCAAWFYECRRVARTVAFTPGTPNVRMWLNIEEPSLWLCNWRPNGSGYSKAGFCHWEPMLVWGDVLGDRATDVIRAPIIHDPGAEPHPCPKPIEWALQSVRLLSPEGGTVLDPFMGSGTTGVACVREGRSFIGIEREPEYHAIAEARIAHARGETPVNAEQPALPFEVSA